MIERFELFTVLIANLARNIRRIKTEEMARWNLKSHHVSCLYYLYQRKSLTAKELCDICEEDKANVSRAIEHLEDAGFLKCESNNHKRYKSHFELTEKGEKVGFNIHNRINNILSKVGEGITEENRRIMYECLNRINENLQNVETEYSK